MSTPPPQSKLRPKKYGLGVGGLALFGTGGCLMWTVVLIPLALPLALVGLAMAIGSLFVKTEPFTCPKCQSSDRTEKQVSVLKCPACETVLKREGTGWAVL